MREYYAYQKTNKAKGKWLVFMLRQRRSSKLRFIRPLAAIRC